MCLINNILLILCFVQATSFGFVSAQAAAQHCSNSLSFRSNSSYNINRRLILSSLASNVSSRDGFYTVSAGVEPQRIHVLGLCIPRTDPQVCSDCIKSVSISLLEGCPNQTNSFEWRGDKTLCFIRYSNRSFSDSLDQTPTVGEYNTGIISGNITEFKKVWEDFMDHLILSASSTSTSDLSAGRHYAANATTWTRFQNIYAVMQCIPGLSSWNCDACLRTNVGYYQDCCGKNKGGSIWSPTCFFHWELYPFLGAFDNIALPPSQGLPDATPPPSPDLPHTTQPPSQELPDATKEDGKAVSRKTVIMIAVAAALIVALLALGFALWKKKKSRTTKLKTDGDNDDDIISPESLQFDFKTLETATDRFSGQNKVGQGGFGEVYKGVFPNGTEIAVKRLSKSSGQGLKEFKNEVVVVAKLQHRNLVRILGFCLEGEEQILVYEFVHNKSLDYFLFDATKQQQLDWTRRYNIIGGIARGILYLHQDARFTIIHRDLKASNILLDLDMNPKIADFGMARIFEMEQTRADTSKIAGTFGYMAPEYVMHGHFSIKSDVYSFGVLVLEIVSGMANSSFHKTDGSTGNLVTHAWKLWRSGSPLKLMDVSFRENYKSDEVIRCIHIALLCVQQDPADRPTMAAIILMLTSNSITMPMPHEPNTYFTD